MIQLTVMTNSWRRKLDWHLPGAAGKKQGIIMQWNHCYHLEVLEDERSSGMGIGEAAQQCECT